jgi:hypothetical protein
MSIWQNGDARDCKSLGSGSIPLMLSSKGYIMLVFAASLLTFLSVHYILSIGFYGIVGICYVIFDWFLRVYRLKNKILSITEQEILNYVNVCTLNAESEKKLNAEIYLLSIKKHYALDIFGKGIYPPSVSNHKSDIFWVFVLWPIFLVYTLFVYVAADVWNAIFNKVKNVVDALTIKILP